MTVLTTPSTTLYPARTGPRAMTAEDLWAIPRVGAPEPSRDGTWCVVPVTTYDLEKNAGSTRLWRVSVPDGESVPLTSVEHSSTEPALSPDGHWLAFCRKDEQQKPQLHLMPLDGGEARKVTDLPLGAFDPRWLPDGSGVVFVANLISGHLTLEATRTEIERRGKDPVKAHVTEDRFYRYWDTWLTTGEVPHFFVYDVESESVRDLTPDSTLWIDWMEPSGQYDIAPDGKELAFAGLAWDTQKEVVRSAIYTVAVPGGAVTCLTPDNPANDLKPRYSNDGRTIAYGKQVDPYFYADRVRMIRYDRAKKTHTECCTGWDRSPAGWSFGPDGTLYLETEDNARVSVYACLDAGTPERILVGGWVSGVEVAGGKLFMALQTLVAPAEVHVCTLEGGSARRVTRFTDAAFSAFATGEVREMTFEGAEGESVQMFVVLPPGYVEGRRYPLVQVIHGGPHAVSGDQLHARWNPHLFAAPGYVVGLVNFQGSTSWGQDFAQRIQGAWADRPFEDVMRGTDALIAAGLVDERRMAAAGGSYGGYMAAWVAGHTDRFRCIVNHAGVYDALAQYASDWTMGRGRAWGGEAWDGLEAIDSCNPARYAKDMTTPMLVLHGERDYRVPINHGLECYGVLKAKGVPARLVYFPDENHWVLKPRNSLLWYREIHAWLARWLAS